MYRLLIVDDNPNNVEKTKSLLDWSAYGITSVMTAGSYVEAVGKAMDITPHAALINIRLGSQMGYELVSHLRSTGLKTVFCMISDDADPNLILESMRSGAQDFLLRPLQPSQLQAFLQRTLAKGPSGSTPESAASKNGIDPVLGVPYSSLSKITNKIILVVRSNYRSLQTLSAIAEELNMSSKYIGRVFLKDTGIKFSEYLMSYRMLEAKKLIINTQEKISVIASLVGYVQLNNFYIHFKNYFGVSPGVLRNFEAPQDPTELGSTTGECYEKSV